MRFKNAQHIAQWRLCVGCGACAYICPENRIVLTDRVADGIRPALKAPDCDGCDHCVKVCPGYTTAHQRHAGSSGIMDELRESWGPILEIWEGHAVDPDIRYRGSSGGVASALALYCIERENMHGLLHIAADPAIPYSNKTVLSRTRAEILSRTGSRYAPASPCDSLSHIEAAPNVCAFIGKPCDVVALQKARSLRSGLDKKIGIAIGIFCAGTPSTTGTLELLKKQGVHPDDVQMVRYRGEGWPGTFKAKIKGKYSRELSYSVAWGFLQKYRPYRCHLCPDGTSEFADISCGDPWYRNIEEGEQGLSLVLVRTEKGREILSGALEAGYVALERAHPEKLFDSQRNLFLKRSAVWGRLLAMKTFGIPTPRLEGFSLFRNWMKLSLRDKLRSTAGTARRIIRRKYYKPVRSEVSH
ncbi:MAG: Coenzyme F420 hydrogenase/dehydrogenase, beta subunit C-terminal domain [Nitrospirota bacterium]